MGIDELYCRELARTAQTGRQASYSGTEQSETSFGDLLKERAADSLNFSRHAAKRMDERGIPINNQLMSDLEQAVEGARKKGAKDVAVIGSQGVFIVNVPNHVVVTTLSPEDMKDKVFTNIDSAVLM